MDYDWNFRVIWLFRQALFNGTITTVQLTILTIVFGTLIGLALALGRLSHYRTIKWPCIVIIEFFRALPLLVLLVWIYYCLPILLNVRISAFTTAAIGLSINLAAFAAETFRAGIEAIPAGFVEASRALGMSSYQTMRRIIVPQATRQMLPPFVGLYITMLKLSSLASVVSVTELLHSANNIIANTYRPLEIYTVIALVYVILVLPGTLLSQRLEAKSLFKQKEESITTIGR